MSGIHDGVSKLWIIRTPAGSLDLSGYKDEVECIDALIRVYLLRHGDAPEVRDRLRAAVEDALTHLEEDEDDGPVSGGQGDDEEEATDP